MQLTALKRAAWAAAALLVTTAAQAEISDNVVKIGVLSDMNGPASTPTGQGSVTAAQMAVDDFGGKVLDKPISVIVGDHQLKPDIGAAIARRWYDTEQVDLIVDVPVSAVGLAVQTIATEKKRLFITQSTGAADFHGKFCSPYAMQWVFDTRALATGTAKEVVKRGGDSWFFITDDYAFGHSLERDAAGVVTANGGKVVLLTTSFYWDMDDKTREWSKRYFAKMNRMPTMWQAGVYSAVTHYLNAVRAAGSDDPLAVAAKMRETPVEDFFARNGRLRADNLMVHDLVLAQVKSPDESKYPWDYYKILATIKGEEAFGPPDPACPLIKR